MWRDSSWEKGYHIDNHKKFRCWICGKEFIVGEKLLEDCSSGNPICPYCGNTQTECTAESTDEQLEELAGELGCLGIYVNENEKWR